MSDLADDTLVSPPRVASSSPADTPSLVLLPGLDGTGSTFDSFVAERPDGCAVQVVRYPGDRFLGYDALLNLIWDVLPHGRPFFLLGESFSGPLALRAAARHPAGLRGVVLCASFATSPTPWLWRQFPALFTPALVRGLIRLERGLMRWFPQQPGVGLNDVVRQATQAVSAEVLAARVRATLAVNVTGELGRCPVPLLYLAGRRDIVVPARCYRLIQRLRPDTVVREIDGPHALLPTRPKEVWETLQQWMSEVELGTGITAAGAS